jgi:hypothetical protein
VSNDLSDRALVSMQEARRYVWRDENDAARDDILVDAVDYVSETIWDECQREFAPTTVPARSGADGVTNGTTTFTAATGAFTAGDEGKLVSIVGKGYYRVVTFTNSTTVVLDGSPSVGTALTWEFSETRTFELGARGLVDLAPYDLLEVDQVVVYSDQASPQTLTSDEYKLLPVGRSPAGTYLSLRTIWPAVTELQPGFGWEAQVSGFWGMAAVPEKIKAAALMWIKNIAENPGGYASASMSGYAVVPEIEATSTLTRAGMPPAVRYRLARWARGGLVA